MSARARDYLLRLTVAAATGQGLAQPELDDAEWQWLAGTVRGYRLGPLLAATDRTGFPQEVDAAIVRQARFWSYKSLAQRNEICRLAVLLGRENVDYAMLKGASLSLSAYADPALRAMRDLDVLVGREDSARAYDLLLANGYAVAEDAAGMATEGGHHMPPLRHREAGIYLDLHHSVGRSDDFDTDRLTRLIRDTAVEREVAGRSVRIAAPAANFLHLVAHANHNHLFQVGPQFLADLAVLVRQDPGALDALAEHAAECRLTSAVQLSLQLLERYGCARETLPCPALLEDRVPDELIEQASKLMVQDTAVSRRRHMMQAYVGHGSAMGGTLAALSRSLTPARRAVSRSRDGAAGDAVRWRDYLTWLWQRGRRYLAGRTDRALLAEARRDVALRRWLSSQEERPR